MYNEWSATPVNVLLLTFLLAIVWNKGCSCSHLKGVASRVIFPVTHFLDCLYSTAAFNTHSRI